MRKREDGMYQRNGIYALRDKVTGFMYIGQTIVTFGDRRDVHFSELRNNKHWVKEIQEAWNRSNGNDVEFLMLHDLKNNEDIDELERFYIAKYRDAGFAVNFGNGGKEGALHGKHLTDEAKRKIGEKNRLNMLGRKASDETRAKMSATRKEKMSKLTAEEKKAMVQPMLNATIGIKWTEERRKQYSDAQKTNPHGYTLSLDTVHEIRRLHEEDGLSYKEIAERLNLNKGTVYGIATYRRWAYV